MDDHKADGTDLVVEAQRWLTSPLALKLDGRTIGRSIARLSGGDGSHGDPQKHHNGSHEKKRTQSSGKHDVQRSNAG